MFKVYLTNGKTLEEKVNCPYWNAVPSDGIERVELITFDGKVIALPKCEKYFYSVEAISKMSGDKPTITGNIIGGVIDDKAIYITNDINSNTTIELKDIKDLSFADFVYKKGV